MIKKIDRAKCDVCETRLRDTCPIMESCFKDVIRLDADKRPFIAYKGDCCNCHRYYYACQIDCPLDAVTVSGSTPFLGHSV